MKNIKENAAVTADEKRINNLVEQYHLVYNKRTNLYDCKRSVEVKSDLISDDGKLIVKFGVVKGNFTIYIPMSLNSLVSLDGVPNKVGKDFIIREAHRLTSLIGSPKEVGRDFIVKNCDRLKSLEGAPQKVGRDFCCSRCGRLQSLEGAPQEVKGTFDCYGCDSLKSLKGAPQKVGRDFNCSCCSRLKSLEGAPKEIGMGFYCYNCDSLKSLEGVPKEIRRDIDISGCENIESLDGIYGDEDINNNCSNQTSDEQTNVQDDTTHTCCICGKEFTGYGNNPSPIMDNGKCCDECDRTIVKPARILFGRTDDTPKFSGLKETEVVKVMVHPAKDVLTKQELDKCYSDSSSAYTSCFNTLVRNGTTYVEGYIPYGDGRLLMPFAVNKTSDGRYFDSSLARKEPFEFFVKKEYTTEEIFHIHGTARMSYLTIGNDPKILQSSSN